VIRDIHRVVDDDDFRHDKVMDLRDADSEHRGTFESQCDELIRDDTDGYEGRQWTGKQNYASIQGRPLMTLAHVLALLKMRELYHSRSMNDQVEHMLSGNSQF
jgi:hypothetical protein